MKENQAAAIEEEGKIEGPIFRILEKSDLQNVLRLMEEIKPMIGGGRDRSLYYALCQEALLDKRVVFIVVEEQSKVIAFYLAIIDRNRWRISFMIRRPLIVARLIFSRTANKLSKLTKKADNKAKNGEHYMPDINKFITTASSNKSWKDSSPQIAKLLYLAVTESHRGKSIGKGLVKYIMKVLADRGVRRVDGIILLNNIPSIRLIYGLGFNLYKRGGSLFVTKDI